MLSHWKESMTNLDSKLKSRDITLSTKVRLIKAMVFLVVMYGCESWPQRKLSTKGLMLLNCAVGKDSWEPLGQQGDPTSPSKGRSVLGVHWSDWCWSWNSKTVATSGKELTHWKRSWSWEGLGARGEGDNRGWDGWMASQTWTWVWSLGDGDGQGGLACWCPWVRKESDTTEGLKWTKWNWRF